LLVEVLICLLLMILIRNKTLKPVGLMFFFLLGSGFSLALSSALCRGVQLSL
jgi:hypothetical protein